MPIRMTSASNQLTRSKAANDGTRKGQLRRPLQEGKKPMQELGKGHCKRDKSINDNLSLHYGGILNGVWLLYGAWLGHTS